MNRIEIPEAGIRADIPASYTEMSRAQVFHVMRQLHFLQQGKMSLPEFRVRIFYEFARVKRTIRSIVWERLHPRAAYRRAERISLLSEQLLAFLFSRNGNELQPAFDSVTNYLPKLRIGPFRFVGPADGLVDISFDELIAADAELALYSSTRNDCHIDNMIATLYHAPGPMQPCGRKVEPFNPERVAHDARIIRRLQPWKKQLILLWYAACIDNLQHGIFIVNGREVCFEALFAGNESGEGKSLGWLGVLFDLAEKRTFGNMTETGQANIIDVLSLLMNYKYTSDNVRKHRTTD